MLFSTELCLEFLLKSPRSPISCLFWGKKRKWERRKDLQIFGVKWPVLHKETSKLLYLHTLPKQWLIGKSQANQGKLSNEASPYLADQNRWSSPWAHARIRGGKKGGSLPWSKRGFTRHFLIAHDKLARHFLGWEVSLAQKHIFYHMGPSKQQHKLWNAWWEIKHYGSKRSCNSKSLQKGRGGDKGT